MDPSGSRRPLLFSNRALVRLLWPLVIEQLLTVLVGIVDVWMVSNVGESALSGVALADSVNYLFIQVIFALTSGGTVVCAQLIGAGDRDGAGRAVAQLVLLTVSLFAVVAVFFLLGGRGLYGMLFGQVEADVMDDAVTYMLFTASSFPFMALYYSAAAAFRAQGETRVTLVASLFMNALNIAGNAVCIFGLHMGVEGVAIPTLAARAIAALGMLLLLQRSSSGLRIRSWGQLRPDRTIMGRIVSIGGPNGIESGLFNFGKVLLQSLVSTLGTPSIAAYAVASNLVTFLYLPGNALGAGMLTVVGQCYGAGEHGQAKMYARKLLLVNYAMLAVICTVLVVGVDTWVGIYQLSGQAAEAAQQLIVAHSVAMCIWPPAFLLTYYFRAVGRAMLPMVVGVATMLVFRVGLAYLFVLVLGKGVLWVWFAMFADWAARMVVFVVAFAREKRG